ncbi:MAG: urea carboxylase-associated family protein [Kineosporiaceae bacterium]
MLTIDVPPKSGRAVRMSAGQRLRVTDVEGQQVADLVAFTPDAREWFSQGFTRMNQDTMVPALGQYLISQNNTKLLQITDDPVGVHDMYYPPCNRYYYEEIHGLAGKTGCRDHLFAALEEHGVPYDLITDPFNVFMNTDAVDGKPVIKVPTSVAGDHFEVTALVDLIVAVSACAADIGDCNGGVCTGLRLEVLD